jgi:4-amino-4-deoxy-L-arabinose transferase-like glycosyltransferase
MNALGALFTAAVAWSLGSLLFRVLGLRLKRTEHDLLAGIAGASLLSLAVFLLCAIRMARTPLFVLLGLLPLAFATWQLLADRRRHRPAPALPPVPAFWKWLFAVGFAFYALLYLSNSLAPEHSPDGATYHLGLVARYFRDHGFVPVTGNFYASLSQGMEMLFLFAFSVGEHPAAATVHCLFLFALPLLMVSYGRRAGHPGAGVTSALLVYLSPLAGIDGVSAYNDIALATVAFSLFYLLAIWRERGDDRLLIPIGMLAGFCFAIKYTGFVAPLYAAVVLLTGRSQKGRVVRAAAVSAVAALVAFPWLLKNRLIVGNPVSPFLNRLFPNPFVHISFEDFYRSYLATYGLPSFKPLFTMVTVTGELGGQLGPVFLLAPLALLALRYRTGRHILLAALFFLLPYPQNIGARFLLPALPFVAFGLALALEIPALRFTPAIQTLLVAAALLLAWPRVIDKYRAPAGGWQITTMPWQAALHLTGSSAWLLAHSADYALAQQIDRTVPANKRLWSTLAVAEAYTRRDVLVYYYSAQCEAIQDLLLTPVTEEMQPRRNLRFTFSPFRYRRLRLLLRTTSPAMWSIAETKFFAGDREIPAGYAESKTFPWDIPLAFDGNPVTRWRSWEPMREGMYVDFSFDKPEPIDRVELHYSADQGDIDVRLDGVDAKVERADLPPPGDLRLLATAAVKARGVDYLLIGGNHPVAADMRAGPARWGLRLAAERDADRIYEIQ